MGEDFRARLLAASRRAPQGKIPRFFAGGGKDVKTALEIVAAWDEAKSDGESISVDALRRVLVESVPSWPEIQQNALAVWLRSRVDNAEG